MVPVLSGLSEAANQTLVRSPLTLPITHSGVSARNATQRNRVQQGGAGDDPQVGVEGGEEYADRCMAGQVGVERRRR